MKRVWIFIVALLTIMTASAVNPLEVGGNSMNKVYDGESVTPTIVDTDSDGEITFGCKGINDTVFIPTSTNGRGNLHSESDCLV